MSTIIINPSQLEALAALMRQTAGEYDAAAVRVNAAESASCPPSVAAIVAEACTVLGMALSELASGFINDASMLDTRASEAIAANTGGNAVSVSGWTPAISTGGAVATLMSTGDPFTDIMNAEAAAANDPANSMAITWGGVPDPSSQPADETTITWGAVPDPMLQPAEETTITWSGVADPSSQPADETRITWEQSGSATGVMGDSATIALPDPANPGNWGPDPYTAMLSQSHVPSPQVLAAPWDGVEMTSSGLVNGSAGVLVSVENYTPPFP